MQCSLGLCYLYYIIMLDELGLGTMESVLAIADVMSYLVLSCLAWGGRLETDSVNANQVLVYN